VKNFSYLTYLIEHYTLLSDITIFIHAHQYSWHNVDELSRDTATMINHLSLQKVKELGYLNLRCAWEPGCASPLRPINATMNVDRPEQMVWSTAWQELFPDLSVPEEVAQPAGAQFAVSRACVLRRPRSEYEDFRRWLLHTNLDSSRSGRVWEYLWHIVFTGEFKLCIPVSECLCITYGMCWERERS
jgi:hypothetical protein